MYTEIYPCILKVSCISPTLEAKPRADKPMDFIGDNKIILEDHHGSRKDHSTLTALSLMNHSIINDYHSGKISTIIQTNLSVVFDTVDHNILISKLDHYGI